MPRSLLWSVSLIIAVGSIPVYAGICTERAHAAPQHEFRFLAGYSADSPAWLGTAPNRRFVMVEASYSYRCWSWNHASLSYGAGVIPAAIVRQPSQIVSTAFFPAARIIPPHSVYGFGVLPIGLYAEFLRHRRLHPILEGNGGILASTEPVPELGDNATGLNFIFNGGVGVRWNASQQSAVTLGYRWVHISNAETTSFNPGLDNNVFYVSYSFLR
jgi:hypothetical protein